MKILLYGGTFDPPHNGHLNNLRAAAARVRPDRVVVMPAGLSPFKQRTSAPGALRLEMCGCFRALADSPDIPQLEVSGWEIAQAEAGKRNYTVLTVEKLAQENPGAQLYLAIGSDMLLSFDGWFRWQDILRLAHLVVTSRNVGDDPELHAMARQLDPTGARILFAPVQSCCPQRALFQVYISYSMQKGQASSCKMYTRGEIFMEICRFLVKLQEHAAP